MNRIRITSEGSDGHDWKIELVNREGVVLGEIPALSFEVSVSGGRRITSRVALTIPIRALQARMDLPAELVTFLRENVHEAAS